jgi:hypothetical protein
MRRALYLASVASALIMLALHVATWRGFVFPLGLSIACAGCVLTVLVPAAVEQRLRASNLEDEVHPMGFVYCALLGLYAVLLWFLTLDQRGGTAGGTAASAYAALWWSRKRSPPQLSDEKPP